MPAFPSETRTATPALALTRLAPRLRRFLIWTLLLLASGYTFLDYWAYSTVQQANPSAWEHLATGQGIAPAQYRIGIYYSASFIAHLNHLPFRYIFTAYDFVSLSASLAVLFFMLTRSPLFRASTRQGQWTQVLLALLLTQIYLVWSLWFQEPETMPSLAILAASALLCSGQIRIPRPMLAVTLLLVAALGSTIRVDSVIAFHAGLLLACLVSKSDTIPIGKAWQAGISILALVLALGIERFIVHALFPHAAREAALVQLPANLHAVNGVFVLLLSLPSWALTIWLAFKHWTSLNAWARGLILGSLIHFAMFLTFGMSEEVRIFLPFVLVLLPISVPSLLTWFEDDPALTKPDAPSSRS